MKMKSIFKYFILLSAIAGITSCVSKEELLLPDSSDNSTMIIASVENFSKHNVSTKATVAEEKAIDNIAMLVFGEKDGEMVLVADPLCIDGNKPNFVINLGSDGRFINNIQVQDPKPIKPFDGESCRVYLVANMNTYLSGLTSGDENSAGATTEAAFLNITYTLPEPPAIGAGESFVDIPSGGFPMVGYKDVTLSGTQQQTTSISMKKLFAKITVRFRVQNETKDNPEDMGLTYIPYFAPGKWKVHNIPRTVALKSDAETVAYPISEENIFNTIEFDDYTFGNTTAAVNRRIQHSTSEDEYFEFSFYVPENRVVPVNPSFSYPDKIDDNSKQFYKPQVCAADQFPTYVEITGKYSDYRGHISDVTYLLYLGQNNYDDFQVIRNQELYNELMIKGLTNHSNGLGEISIDHRVNVTSSGYSIAMERETLLDSHFELRPMDISVEGGGTVRVVIPKNSWFGAERSDAYKTATDNSKYDMSTNEDGSLKSEGLRKYFTTNLISELGSTNASKEFVFTAPDNVGVANYRLWFYFDEYTNPETAYDYTIGSSETNPLFREEAIKVYYIDANDESQNQEREFKFRQMNLWAINADINDYYIEYFEEYLYNYAADDNFGVTKDGMEWGLEDVPLSIKYPAINVKRDNIGGLAEFIYGIFGGSFQSYFNDAFNKAGFHYDFYLSRDGISKSRDYAGIQFTREIVSNAKINSSPIMLSENASSAVEYCYNKNKRDNDGKVNEIHWYLPAIDETEEILVAGFDYFDVFQAKYYWSSQPSFDKYNFSATITQYDATTTGTYYTDNTSNARATIVTVDNTGALSGVTGSKGTSSLIINDDGSVSVTNDSSGGNQQNQVGNKSRKEEHRVRCAYSNKVYPHIYGTYVATMSDDSTIEFGICNSNDPTKGNIMLSNYIHSDYNDAYPLYGNYNKETGILTINVASQVIGIAGAFDYNVYPRLYNVSNNNAAQSQTLTLQYDVSTNNFTLINASNIRLGAYYDRLLFGEAVSRGNYIRSITRAN